MVLASIILIIVLAGAFAAILDQRLFPAVNVPSMTIKPSQVISLWKAICWYYCGSNHTSIPGNVSVELGLYDFYMQTNEGSLGGGYDSANVEVNLTTGLPEKQVVEPYPDGVVVNTHALGGPSCTMYMLLWSIVVPSKIPYGGSSWIDAISGFGVTPRDVSTSLTCPPGNVTATTLPSSDYE